MTCPSCGAQNDDGRKFCGECGAPLAQACPACGAANPPTVKFCGECGTTLRAGAQAPAAPEPAPAPAAERRLVSVLFADLVGFTSASESRDPEETRELLSRYFDTSRRLIELYGGTVEKFIGDAVMAVWGTPVATEDDAERAVRAALDLVAAVSALGDEVGAVNLRARAGVMTGEAAVTIGAQGEGMVAGDLVNTASRIQSVAEPGTVLVGDATRRATEAAIAYGEPLEHGLKGKSEPVRVYRALRVTAGRLGTLKAAGLEPPFVGRDRELRLVKELFHATAEERKARLVSAVGVAGIGKSRLAWEFEKYIDGLVEVVFWHRGRCLAYGEGVAYWALAEMVRMRCDIVEAEDTATAREKLTATLAEHVPDPDERAWVEPRLAHLLGLEERTASDKEDLFGAWRLFFERLAEQEPTVLVFEDLQWADAGLLEFIEYLLEWSRDHALYVITLARPEFTERHAGWGTTKRNSTSLYLEPLPDPAIEELLDGLVPGLPEELRDRIRARAEGIPLYAVETVRMLLDRELVVQEGAVYRPAGDVGLDVPETLHALIAARLDGLSTEERRLVQDAAVLGKTFTRQGLAAMVSMPEEDLGPLLASLTRKEILGVQADPRSPERGQYGFVQDLLRTVAYETLPRRERRSKHLAVATFLEASWGSEEEEIVEVVAAHYVDAYRAAPDDPDAATIRSRAKELLVEAAERALSLAAGAEAQRYFEQAVELTEDAGEAAELRERAGQAAWTAGKGSDARGHFERAIALHEEADEPRDAARVRARLGEVDLAEGHLDDALERLEAAFSVLGSDTPDPDAATVAAEIGRIHYLRGDAEAAAPFVDTALDAAENLRLPELISQTLNTKGAIAIGRSHVEESLALLGHALQVALDADLPAAALRAYYNLGFVLFSLDRHTELLELDEAALALARRAGYRTWEWQLRTGDIITLFYLARWDDALRTGAELEEVEDAPLLATVRAELFELVRIHINRGEFELALELISRNEELGQSEQAQLRPLQPIRRSELLRLESRYEDALSAAEEGLAAAEELGWSQPAFREAFLAVVESALAAGRLERAEELLSRWDRLLPGQRAPYAEAHVARLRARLGTADGDDPERGFKNAAALFRELEMPFWLAVTLLEHGEWLAGEGRAGEAEPLLVEARETFERLEARPWLERSLAAHPAEVPA